METRFCVNCGCEVDAKRKKCDFCGKRLPTEREEAAYFERLNERLRSKETDERETNEEWKPASRREYWALLALLVGAGFVADFMNLGRYFDYAWPIALTFIAGRRLSDFGLSRLPACLCAGASAFGLAITIRAVVYDLIEPTTGGAALLFLVGFVVLGAIPGKSARRNALFRRF